MGILYWNANHLYALPCNAKISEFNRSVSFILSIIMVVAINLAA